MTLFIQRHAPTKDNAETPGPEKIRGWGPVGISPEGEDVDRDLDFAPPEVDLT